MKTRFNNSTEVMHVFAQRTQFEGRASNVFFYGEKIYSHGYHYLLAEFKTINNKLFILINNSGDSHTTSKHIAEVRQATRQYKQYFTLDVDFDYVYNSIVNNFNKLLKVRKQDIYTTEIINKFESLTNYPLFNNIVKKTAKYKEIEKIYKHVNNPEYISNAKELNKKKEEKEKRAKDLKLKKDLKKFMNYEIDYIKNDEDFVRISKDKTSVETSQCIDVPINEAKLLYSLINNGMDIKGRKIGNYTVISINGVLKIGCHHINIKNMHKIGNQLLKINL